MLVTLGCISLIGTACQKYDGDSYDFTNKERNYINFTDDDPVGVNEEVEVEMVDTNEVEYHIYEPVDVSVDTRMAFTEDIHYSYVIKLEGFETKTGSGIIKMGTTSSTITLDYPEDVFPAGVEEAEGTLELTGANGAKYGDLRMGYPNVGDQIVIPLTVYKPRME